jgi:hypothetical protein
MIDVSIRDSKNNRMVGVTDDNKLLVANSPYPLDEPQTIRPFRQNLTSDGIATGPADMKVVGTLANPILFWVPSSNDYDRYILNITVTVAGASPALYQFGTITALTNGCQLYYLQASGVPVMYHPALKTNFDIVRVGGDNQAGIVLDKALSATIGVYMVTIKLNEIMPPYGLKLEKGSPQRLIMSIRDDLTPAGVAEFKARVSGFEKL